MTAFLILPEEFASAELQERVAAILRFGRVLEHLPAAQKVVVRVGSEVPAGAALAEAHGVWTAARVPDVQTPDGLPRQLEDARCPPGLVRVSIECIRRLSGGMSSYYGWDARGEEATG